MPVWPLSQAKTSVPKLLISTKMALVTMALTAIHLYLLNLPAITTATDLGLTPSVPLVVVV